MLREARIILPYDTGDGEADRKAHAFMAEQLTKHFGGFTVFSGQGAWAKDEKTIVYDEVKIYDVAAQVQRHPEDQLRRIAREAGMLLDQDSVYIRYADGKVDIIELRIAGSEAATQEAELSDAADWVAKQQKRLPQVGDIWETRCGALVAVLSQASVLDGGFNVVTLTRGQSARQVGIAHVVDLDGCILRDKTPAAYDLTRFKSRFVDDPAA